MARVHRRRLEQRIQPERRLDGAADHPAGAGDETTRLGPSHLAGQRRCHDAVPRRPGLRGHQSANANLAVSLAKELAGTGITSNAVSPGMIVTPGVEEMLKRMAPQFGLPADDLPALEQYALKNMVPNPSARLGRPEDIASAVTFVASPLAGYINGVNLRVDGGTVPTVN